MKSILFAMLMATTLLAACAVVPADRYGNGPGTVVIAPVLPSLVVLEADPYYFHAGFNYYFSNNHWYYSQSRRGPWAELPRGHYPRETRYRGRSWRYGAYDRPVQVGIVIAPILPRIVVLDKEPYYLYNNFHYYFNDNRWYYSKSYRGPWTELPRDRYPEETRYRGKSWKYSRKRYDRDSDRRDGRGPVSAVIVPALPQIVVLEREPYYSYRNYNYFYNNNRWYYSKSNRGPWTELPRNHYPRETRYRGKSWKHDRDRDGRDRYDRDRDRGDRGYDYRSR